MRVIIIIIIIIIINQRSKSPILGARLATPQVATSSPAEAGFDVECSHNF